MISLKITSIGNVDSGKSTLIGVLTKGINYHIIFI